MNKILGLVAATLLTPNAFAEEASRLVLNCIEANQTNNKIYHIEALTKQSDADLAAKVKAGTITTAQFLVAQIDILRKGEWHPHNTLKSGEFEIYQISNYEFNVSRLSPLKTYECTVESIATGTGALSLSN